MASSAVSSRTSDTTTTLPTSMKQRSCGSKSHALPGPFNAGCIYKTGVVCLDQGKVEAAMYVSLASLVTLSCLFSFNYLSISLNSQFTNIYCLVNISATPSRSQDSTLTPCLLSTRAACSKSPRLWPRTRLQMRRRMMAARKKHKI